MPKGTDPTSCVQSPFQDLFTNSCWANVLHFYAMPQTTRLACTEKQSWVGLSHFWKTYTLYLFAICDTDLQSGCHIFGRLTGAEIWLGDQAEAKCRCGRKIKTQSDIFLQVTQTKQASTVSYQETKWNIPRITEAILPSHTLLFGHCDFHAYI